MMLMTNISIAVKAFYLNKIKFFSILIGLLLALPITGQTVASKKSTFTRQDTLRGSITAEREWWALTYYNLDIEVKPEERFIGGKNTVMYRVLEPNQVMQID